MKFPFKELPGRSEDYLRPVLPVTLDGLDFAPQLCLLDTGALHNRFGAWLAEAAGIDLAAAPEERIALGGFVSTARRATTRLSAGGLTWEAEVWFCHPWPLSFHLLGQEGFFRWFDVRISTARYTVELAAAGDT